MKHLLEYEEFKELYQLNELNYKGAGVGAAGGAVAGGAVGAGKQIYQNYKKKKEMSARGEDTKNFKITRGVGKTALKYGAVGGIAGAAAGSLVNGKNGKGVNKTISNSDKMAIDNHVGKLKNLQQQYDKLDKDSAIDDVKKNDMLLNISKQMADLSAKK